MSDQNLIVMITCDLCVVPWQDQFACRAVPCQFYEGWSRHANGHGTCLTYPVTLWLFYIPSNEDPYLNLATEEELTLPWLESSTWFYFSENSCMEKFCCTTCWFVKIVMCLWLFCWFKPYIDLGCFDIRTRDDIVRWVRISHGFMGQGRELCPWVYKFSCCVWGSILQNP